MRCKLGIPTASWQPWAAVCTPAGLTLTFLSACAPQPAAPPDTLRHHFAVSLPPPPADKYITHRMKFDQINEAFELLHSGGCLRTVLTFD